MIKYSGIYESNAPPPNTKALWVDGGKLKVYKNNNWESVDDPKFKLTIDTTVRQGSTNPVSSGAVYNTLKDKADLSTVEVNTGNIKVLIERMDETQGTANTAKDLATNNTKSISQVVGTANAANRLSQENRLSIKTLDSKVTNIKNVSDGNQQNIKSLTYDVIQPLESKVSNLLELNVVYPSNIRTLTTDSTVDEVKKAFIPKIGGSTNVSNTPHVGYLIKGVTYADNSGDAPDSTIISVDIIKTEGKTYHKFIYIDNNTTIVSLTVDLINYKLIDKSILANIETNSKVGTLRDLYIQAGAKYNEETGYYELNGLTDITEEEMRAIYNRYLIDTGTNNAASGWLSIGVTKIRTNLPCIARADIFSDINNSISGQYIEVLRICAGDSRDYNRVCYVTRSIAVAIGLFPRLKKVIGIWRYNNDSPNNFDFGYGQPFSNCPLLEEIRMARINKSHTFAVSPNLSKASVLYMIENANPPSGAAVGSITITLHPNAYAKLKDDADITAALEEKGGVVVLASASA